MVPPLPPGLPQHLAGVGGGGEHVTDSVAGSARQAHPGGGRGGAVVPSWAGCGAWAGAGAEAGAIDVAPEVGLPPTGAGVPALGAVPGVRGSPASPGGFPWSPPGAALGGAVVPGGLPAHITGGRAL